MKHYPIQDDQTNLSIQFQSVASIFNNKFDPNYDYTYSINKKNPITMHRSEEILNERLNLNLVDDESVVYKYNKDNFRCDNFGISHNKKHILFSGCSETEGVGGNIESNWSHMLYSSIKDLHGASGYYNLGIAGNGYLKIINNIMVYIENFGKPDVIFILFPNISRWIDWVDEDLGYQHIGLDPFTLNPKKTANPSDEKTLMVNILNFISTVKIFEKYCKSTGIKLFWSTWDVYDEKTYIALQKNSTIKRFVPMQSLDFHKSLSASNLEKEEFSKFQKNMFRRDGHLGQVFHNHYYDVFLDRYKKEVTDANL